MSNILTQIVLYSILINLVAGVMLIAIVDINGDRVFDNTATGGYAFGDETYGDEFKTELEQTIKPAGAIEDKGDQIYRVLDVMSLGFVYRFFSMVDKFMFGIINIMDNIVGQYLDAGVRTILFGNDLSGDQKVGSPGIFKSILTIAYILMGIKLFTGKDTIEGT